MWTLPSLCYLELSKILYFVFGFFVVYISKNERYKCIYRALITLPRDLDIAYRIGHMLILITYYDFMKLTTPDVFRANYRRHPKKTAFICGENTMTYQEVEWFSNRVSRVFRKQGLRKGEAVAIFLETRVEYPCIWLGLNKLGAIGALINTNQRGQILEHSLRISGAKCLIYGTELTQALSEIPDFIKDLTLYHIGDGEHLPQSRNFMEILDTVPDSALEENFEKDITDKFLYIYTSGTTGLPKAAILTHARFYVMCLAASLCFRLKESDVCYTTLPLYHTAGGLLGVGQVFLRGATTVFRKKFSASNFWTDCIKYNCTVAQYIGEMCRYLLAQPPRPTDRQHSVRVCMGNGLRPQVWEAFVNRFGIERVGEFYGATEGNAAVVNGWNFPGACGYIPWFARTVYPVALIKVDENSNEPIRDSEGLCIPCQTGEPGLLVGKIQKRPSSHFNGYLDKDATEKKILRDVFRKGDKVFNSGDILVKDEYGYVFFKDRTGDTYRWRGENVATCEVEGVISNIVGLKDATVYGVQIPNTEGRAGMAAIVDLDGIIDMKKLSCGIEKNLPPYARPIFVRVIKELPMTSTFKIQKMNLQKDGYNIHQIKDPIYIWDQTKNEYVLLTEEIYSNVQNSKMRL